MAEKGLPTPTPKPVRAKTPAKTKPKALPKPSTSKTSIPLEPRVVIQPIDQQEDQDTFYPPNQPNQLPNIFPAQPEHIPNPQNPPNPPNPPNPSPNLPNQPQQLPGNPLGIMQLQDPPQAHQLNWSYFKPEFSGKMEEDAVVHLLKTND